jgi:lipoprotein-anchoring transpeptidase ErfK/SrfK
VTASAAVTSMVFAAAAAIGLCAAGGAAAQSPPAASPSFYLIPIPRSAAELRQQFTPDQIATLERLNRRDVEHLLRTEPRVPGLIVPSAWPASDDVVTHSPLPDAFPWAEALPKTIVVHQPWQAFAAYESGRLVRWGPVSTGRKGTPTPPGSFNLTWRSKGRYSTDNAAWFLPWYFNFHNERGVSFHQFELPGYAASHACVRLLERDGKWLYEWGDQWTLDDTGRTILTPGTPVLILGEYHHGGPPPWTDLTALSRRVELSVPSK